jgi:hypothetical protein
MLLRSGEEVGSSPGLELPGVTTRHHENRVSGKATSGGNVCGGVYAKRCGALLSSPALQRMLQGGIAAIGVREIPPIQAGTRRVYAVAHAASRASIGAQSVLPGISGTRSLILFVFGRDAGRSHDPRTHDPESVRAALSAESEEAARNENFAPGSDVLVPLLLKANGKQLRRGAASPEQVQHQRAHLFCRERLTDALYPEPSKRRR